MTQPIRVWAIHDDPEQYELSDDRTWLAIAAEDENQALALAAAFYDGDTPRDEWNWTTAFAATEIHTTDWPDGLKPRFPRRITCLETLRLMRWREEGESECDCCGLAAMGMRAYEIRDCCDRCPECCDCGEEERKELDDDDERPF
jgi:hypothetical protein